METKSIEHVLVPKHVLLSDKEKEKLFEKYGISHRQLPKISKDDAAIKHLGLKEVDVVKITRDSPTAGKVVFFRGVTND